MDGIKNSCFIENQPLRISTQQQITLQYIAMSNGTLQVIIYTIRVETLNSSNRFKFAPFQEDDYYIYIKFTGSL